MSATSQIATIPQLQARRRTEQALAAAALVGCALLSGALLLAGRSPLLPALLLIAFAGSVLLGLIWRAPLVGLGLLFGAALLLEQWGIAGLDPLTADTHIYETLSGFAGIPLAISPVELVLLWTLAALLLPPIAARGRRFTGGALLPPLLLFLAAVIGALAYGVLGGPGYAPFFMKAAWAETRSFFYLGATYVLAVNLVSDRRRLRGLVWLFVGLIGVKAVQGVARYIDVRQRRLQLDAITSHEEVVFFSAFLLLLAGLLLFNAHRQQLTTMLWLTPPLLFTFLVTKRRIGFVVLAAGLLLVAIFLYRTRRALFLRAVPLAVVLLGVYTAIFWNGTGTLSEPIRAVRSIVAPNNERDRLSNAWRELEKTNIAFNIRRAPLTGLGFGRPYTFIVEQPSLDETGFTYWRYITHNAVYWVWMKMGALGFLAFWNLIGSAIVFGLLAQRTLRDGYLRAVALAATGLVVMQVVFSYGDLGLTYTRSMLILGTFLGILARLPALDALPEEAPERAPQGRGPARGRLSPARVAGR